MRAASVMLRPLKVRKKVSFFSRQSDTPPADFTILKQLVEEISDDTECVMLTKMLEGHMLSYPFHLLKQIYHAMTSRMIVINGYCVSASVLDLKGRAKVMQIWHAQSAVKKFGYQTVGLPSGRSSETARILNMHGNYDIVTACSARTAGFFSEAMGTDISAFVYTHAPHTVEMVSREAEKRADTRRKLGIGEDEHVILYAPTFRKGGSVKTAGLLREIDRRKYTVIFRPHPLDRDLEEIPGDVTTDTKDPLEDLICAADTVITDYSSIMTEALIMNRRLFIYGYDIDRYKEDPGLNIDLGDERFKGIFFREASRVNGLLEGAYDENGAHELKSMLVDDGLPYDLSVFRRIFSEVLG